MSERPTIIFDLDGTLADTIGDLLSAMNRVVALHGVAPVSASQVVRSMGKGGLRQMIDHAFRHSGEALEEDLLDELLLASVEDYRQNIAVETVLYPGVRASLERFSADGWLLGVCTNKPVSLAEKLLGALRIEEAFVAVTGGDSFSFKKPDPRHLTRTIELAGGSAAAAIMVGDTQADTLAAQNAGVPVIALDFGYSEHPVEEYNPDRVVSSFDALFDEAAGLIG